MQWKKFTERDLKLNVRYFKRWGIHEFDIFEKSPEYNKLKDTAPEVEPRMAVKRKALESTSDSPMKRVYVIASDSTDCDSDGEWA